MNGVVRIGLCTDSTAQLPASLAARFDVEIVPVTITVDGEEYLDGVDLDADGFWARFTGGHRPALAMSQPSPGQFALAYEALIDRGCTEILSIHHTRAGSGALNSARLAAHRLGVPVRLVDAGASGSSGMSGMPGFGASCGVWAAGEALERGAGIDVAAAAAEALVPTIGSVSAVGPIEIWRAGGRLATDDPSHRIRVVQVDAVDGVDGEHRLELVDTVLEAVNAMAAAVLRWGTGLHVAVGHADPATGPIAEALALAVGETAAVDEVVDYRLGPSAGWADGRADEPDDEWADAGGVGPGTITCVMFPTTALGSSTPTAS